MFDCGINAHGRCYLFKCIWKAFKYFSGSLLILSVTIECMWYRFLVIHACNARAIYFHIFLCTKSLIVVALKAQSNKYTKDILAVLIGHQQHWWWPFFHMIWSTTNINVWKKLYKVTTRKLTKVILYLNSSWYFHPNQPIVYEISLWSYNIMFTEWLVIVRHCFQTRYSNRYNQQVFTKWFNGLLYRMSSLYLCDKTYTQGFYI